MSDPAPASQGLAKELDVLQADIAYHIETFRSYAKKDRLWAIGLRMAVAALGALTTFILGIKANLKIDEATIASGIALALSAAIPVFAAWDAVHLYQDNWMNNTANYTALYALDDDIKFARMDNSRITRESVDAFYRRYRSIMDGTNRSWQRARMKKDQASGDKR